MKNNNDIDNINIHFPMKSCPKLQISNPVNCSAHCILLRHINWVSTGCKLVILCTH